MSRFYLIEFRGKRQKYWHPWKRAASKKAAFAEARGYFGRQTAYFYGNANPRHAWRVIEIDTDLGSLTVAKP